MYSHKKENFKTRHYNEVYDILNNGASVGCLCIDREQKKWTYRGSLNCLPAEINYVLRIIDQVYSEII